MKKLSIRRKDLKNNFKIIQNWLQKSEKSPKIIAVIKGNGMGLGLTQYAKFLIKQGIDCLAVANLEEAMMLRKAGIQEEILMLTPTPKEKEMLQLVEQKITVTISSKDQIETAEKIAKAQAKPVQAHLKIDTGFGRYGFLYTQLDEILEACRMCDWLKIEGMYTHFSKPMDEKFTRQQFERFLRVAEFLKKQGQAVRDAPLLGINSGFEISVYEFGCCSNWFGFPRQNAC